MAATLDRNVGLQNYGQEKVSHYVNSDTGSQQQIFTDPQLLKRIRATTPNRTVSINQSIRQPAQYVIDSKPNNTSFVIESKPVHELYVENTHIAPPTEFVYANPPPHIHNVHKTYIVGGSAEKVHPNSVVSSPHVIKSSGPIPLPAPLTVNPAFLIAPQNNKVIIEKPLNKSQSAARVNISNSVSLVEYERMQSECRQWEQKYNDLYRKFTSLASTKDLQADEQINRLRTQNYQLQQRILMYERSQSTINQTVEAYITQLINRHRSSTLKECELLFDRFKLECRQMERDSFQPPY